MSDGDVEMAVRLLAKALRLLGEAGYPARASHLAAEAWAQLRETHPSTDPRLVGLLHYLAQLPSAEDDDVPAPLRNGSEHPPERSSTGTDRGPEPRGIRAPSPPSPACQRFGPPELCPYRKDEPMSAADTVLDVRSEPPVRRHDLIFQTYHALPPGGSFILVNDHDPKPLYYQFSAEHAGEFTWDYLETGPEVWRVRIGRPAD